MTSTDFKETYLHIHIPPFPQKYFTLGKNRYHFWALPFRLASVPRIFINEMVALAASLRCQGAHIYLYFSVLLSRSPLEEASLDTIQHLLLHSFLINIEKSLFTPSPVMSHLGMIVNSVCMKLFLPPHKTGKAKGCIKFCICLKVLLTQFLISISVASDTVSWARVLSRDFQWLLLSHK